jgi:type VI secretion system secreted protein VgrG
MADDEAGRRTIHLGFASAALPADDEVQLHGVHGREQLSRLYEYELLLVRPAGAFSDAQVDDLLRDRCVITLGDRPGDIVHGLLGSIELLDASRDGVARYLARLVPNVSLLTLGERCAVYQQTTVPDLVRTILKGYGLVEGSHFDVRVTHDAKSPEREYLVQYQESDWDFIQRWLEHEGFFYWFNQTKPCEQLVIADANDDTTAIDDPKTLAFRERNVLTATRNTVWDWRRVQRRIPGRIALVDYNYRTPDQILVSTAQVDDRGFGTSVRYGEHFKDSGEGDALAKLRAERCRTEQRTYYGSTDCSRFRVGHTFELENHFLADEDGTYLITSIEHRVGHGVRGQGEEPQPYVADFTAIPIDTPFRPERRTPWPRIYGIMHGHVDADGEGEHAQIDELGRYKVRLPFDSAGPDGLRSSRWIRFAQPYSGAGYGMHHPLHKGTEVLLAFIDGNPDRPIIVGSVPNPATRSPATSANATQSVIQTASGIRVEMEDLQG